MTWYAIRTAPGAQMPQREYVVETTHINPDVPRRGKGYRIVPSLNPKMSAVERALSDIGCQFYMPAEFKVWRNRKKTGVYELRRFPLIPGYVFVCPDSDPANVTAWETIREELKKRRAIGTHEIVGIDGVPLQISIVDIIALRTIEAKSQAKADREVAALNSSVKAGIVRAADKAFKQAKRRISSGQRVRIMWGAQVGRDATVVGWDDQQQLKAIVDSLEAAGTVSVPFDAVKLVA